MKKVSGIWQESRVRLGLFGTSLFVLFLILNFRMSIATAASPQNEAQRAGSQAEQTSDDGAAALTIYNQNFFVAREYVPLDLKAGVNEAHYTGVAAHLEPDSVILRDPHGRALQILEQNYRNDPISQELLLSFYEGKTIDFLVGRNPDGSDIKMKGKVIRSGYVPTNYINGYPQQASTQPIIEVDGVLRFGMPGQPIFPALSADSILKPTLNWLLETNSSGQLNAEISYVSGGMNWQSDYNVVVQDDPGKKTDLLDMIGWITMRNQSGKTFENARIKLLAGDVSKIQAPTVSGMMYRAKVMAVNEEAMAPAVQENRSTNSIFTPCSARPPCAMRKPSRWSSSARPEFMRNGCSSMTVHNFRSMATTIRTRCALTRIMGQLQI